MANWAEKRDAAQRERVLAEQIVARHSEDECKVAWVTYIAGLGPSYAKYYGPMRKALPIQMAELLEPGELAKMMDEPIRRT